MKTTLLLFGALLFCNVADAQEPSCTQLTSGGFGHFMHGPSFYYPSSLIDYLEGPDVLNTDIPARMGTISGGEGAALLGKFIVGGGGFGQTAARHISDSARLSISSGGGYFKFGYVVYNCNNNLGFVYGGIGWGALNVHLENFSQETSIRFDNRNAIPSGGKRDYELSLTYYDLGVSYKRIFNAHTDATGGFMMGIDLGAFITQSTSEWSGERDEVVFGPPVPRMGINPYLRITIGGGGFN